MEPYGAVVVAVVVVAAGMFEATTVRYWAKFVPLLLVERTFPYSVTTELVVRGLVALIFQLKLGVTSIQILPGGMGHSVVQDVD